ncbi:MAG: Nitroreductase family protein [Labilithrix sp.]|nr:Nitroreductase family protein [Labilithrix sp.]
MPEPRRADHPIDPMFTDRWSPRAFDASGVTEAELLSVLEAGRWSTSSSNVQPWRFIYAYRDTPAFATFLETLIPFNQDWAKRASVLVYIVSQKDLPPNHEGKVLPSRTHSFDAGTAWGFIALEAHKKGLHAHAMAGFDHAKAAAALKIPETFAINAVFALGRLGDPSVLPEPMKAREFPSDRRPLAGSAFEGVFPSP